MQLSSVVEQFLKYLKNKQKCMHAKNFREEPGKITWFKYLQETEAPNMFPRVNFFANTNYSFLILFFFKKKKRRTKGISTKAESTVKKCMSFYDIK